MSIIERADKGLEEYYSSFPHATYTNADNVGKFKAFCDDEYGGDDKEIKNALDDNELSLATFDQSDHDSNSIHSETNHFPLNLFYSDQTEREKEIFNIIKYCSIHGKPPENKLYQKQSNDSSNDYTPFNIDNEQKYNYTLFQFTDDTFSHILEDILPSYLTKSQQIQFPSKKRWRGDMLKLNEKQKKHKQSKSNIIEIEINDTLQELIALSRPFKQDKKEETQTGRRSKKLKRSMCNKYEQNTLFHRDFTSLFLDSYHRYCIITEIMDIENTIQKYTYSQLYWKTQTIERDPNRANKNATPKISTYRLISNISPSELENEYHKILPKSKDKATAALIINGKETSHCSNCKGIINEAMKDYKNIIFKFISSHKFYWLLAIQKNKPLIFFKSAFKTYSDKICGPLTLKNINLINDNIFVFWMYIWSMSNVVRTYTQSGNIKIPLQIDLMIISHDNNNKNIGNISERFNIHNQKFETVICDPTNIDSIRQKLESIFLKCSIKMKKKEHRIVIIVDRRSRDEYFKDKNCDRIFGYKPLMRYCQIDKKYEIINAIWNTSNYLLPPAPTRNKIKLIGAKNNKDLFVFTYFIRKKSQFTAVFNYTEEKEEKEEIEQKRDSDIPLDVTQMSNTSSNTAQFADDNESIQSFTTADTLDLPVQPFKTKKAQDIFQRMLFLHQNNQLTSVKLDELLKQVHAQITEAMTPNLRINGNRRAMTVHNLQVMGEFQTLHNHIITMALARKSDSVVNLYVFCNGGYFRFEPWDLIRILPKLFNVNCIANFDNMKVDFKKYHEKLWELDDEIWMKYNEIYLKSFHSRNQKVNEEELGTDPNDRNVIRNYCTWNKNRNNINNEEIKEDTEMKYDKNINVIKNDKHFKKIELNCALNEFIEWKSKSKGSDRGMIVNRIKNNDYKRLLNLGDKLWSIMSIEKENVSEKKQKEINKLLGNINKCKYTIELIGGFFKICDNTQKEKNERVIELSLKLSTFLEWIDNSANINIGGIERQTSKDQQIAMTLQQLHRKKGNGFKISNINNKDYGIAFKETGVLAGWYIKEVNNKDVSTMNTLEFKLFLKTINMDNGYRIKFIYPDRTLSISAFVSNKKQEKY